MLLPCRCNCHSKSTFLGNGNRFVFHITAPAIFFPAILIVVLNIGNPRIRLHLLQWYRPLKHRPIRGYSTKSRVQPIVRQLPYGIPRLSILCAMRYPPGQQRSLINSYELRCSYLFRNKHFSRDKPQCIGKERCCWEGRGHSGRCCRRSTCRACLVTHRLDWYGNGSSLLVGKF